MASEELPTGRAPSHSVCEMTELLLPSHCNTAGIAFGGQIMAWMDICGGVAAKRHSASAVVTASMDFLHFLHPVRVGEVVTIRAVVTRAFTSSMEVGVTVRGENPTTGQLRSCCSCYFTFVARPAADHKSGKGSSSERVRVPPLLPQTEEDQLEYAAAERRRALRIAKNRPPVPRSSSPVCFSSLLLAA